MKKILVALMTLFVSVAVHAAKKDHLIPSSFPIANTEAFYSLNRTQALLDFYAKVYFDLYKHHQNISAFDHKKIIWHLRLETTQGLKSKANLEYQKVSKWILREVNKPVAYDTFLDQPEPWLEAQAERLSFLAEELATKLVWLKSQTSRHYVGINLNLHCAQALSQALSRLSSIDPSEQFAKESSFGPSVSHFVSPNNLSTTRHYYLQSSIFDIYLKALSENLFAGLKSKRLPFLRLKLAKIVEQMSPTSAQFPKKSAANIYHSKRLFKFATSIDYKLSKLITGIENAAKGS